MITPRERWLLDTNVWVFGLRRHPGAPECAGLLDRIGEFRVVIPLQILKELNLNLTEYEINEFYRLINQQPEWMELSWTRAAALIAWSFTNGLAAERVMQSLRPTPSL
jgi:hypothetical protein